MLMPLQRTVRLQQPPFDADIASALQTHRVYEVATVSPLQRAAGLSHRLGHEVLVKREDLQTGFSFKCRGAYNRMAHLTAAELERGVIAASAGNHAQGVALASRRLGCHALIAMPVTTPSIKVQAVRAMGAEVRLVGDSFSEACAEALRMAQGSGRVFIHPFDDLQVIAGQGTVGLEILSQMEAPPHAVFVPVGGGGLLAGVAAAIKLRSAGVRVVGVQIRDSDAMTRSLRVGCPVDLTTVGLFSDGTAVKRVGDLTFELARRFVDEMVLVDTDEVCAAIRDGYEDLRAVVEPAGALALAGLKKYAQAHSGAAGGALVAVASGANLNFSLLRFISARADIGLLQETLWQVSADASDRMLVRLCTLLSGSNITEIAFRRSAGQTGNMVLGLATRSPDDVDQITALLSAGGFDVRHLSSEEAERAQVLHLVNGISLDTDERLFQVNLPERPSALLQFLRGIPEGLRVTLAQYRNDGQMSGRLLLGLQGNTAMLRQFALHLNPG